MKKLINAPDTAVAESLAGFARRMPRSSRWAEAAPSSGAGR